MRAAACHPRLYWLKALTDCTSASLQDASHQTAALLQLLSYSLPMDAPQEPRWLDAEESQAWRALASMLVRLPAALDAQLRRDAGISHFEYQVLALLSEGPSRTLRMSGLATQSDG